MGGLTLAKVRTTTPCALPAVRRGRAGGHHACWRSKRGNVASLRGTTAVPVYRTRARGPITHRRTEAMPHARPAQSPLPKEFDFTRRELCTSSPARRALDPKSRHRGAPPARKEIALIFEKIVIADTLGVRGAAYDEGHTSPPWTPRFPDGQRSRPPTRRGARPMYVAIEIRGAAHSSVEELGCVRGRSRYTGGRMTGTPRSAADFLTMYEASLSRTTRSVNRHGRCPQQLGGRC